MHSVHKFYLTLFLVVTTSVKYSSGSDLRKLQPQVVKLPPLNGTSVRDWKCPVPYALYPDLGNCEYFYLCLDSTAYHIKCPPTLAYNPLRAYCTQKGEVATCLIDNITYQLKCPSDGFQPNKMDCTKFYWCQNKSVTELTCPFGFKFDKNNKYCVPPNYAKCASLLDPILDTPNSNVTGPTVDDQGVPANGSKPITVARLSNQK